MRHAVWPAIQQHICRMHFTLFSLRLTILLIYNHNLCETFAVFLLQLSAPIDKCVRGDENTAAKFRTKWNVNDVLRVYNIIYNYPKYAMENETFVPLSVRSPSPFSAHAFCHLVYRLC